ncbi:ribosomal protein L7/L12 [Kitasatospora sp. NPDC048286]|uniref:ribosomal protein L7/L12 n=1 Tax=Kitasatospora sp. NPDC048286 TaxID=3364047 RepID=UPI00371BBFF0
MAVLYVELVCDVEPIRVVVTHAGPHVLEVAKVVKRRIGLSLWHGKGLLGRLPATILVGVTSDVAEAAADELRAAGATVEVRY